MQTARQTIEAAKAERPVVMFSGGKDSLLTLLLVREVYPDVECIWYRSGSESQRKSVEFWTMKLNLVVYSHEPVMSYYLPMGDRSALVREYAINDATFPVVAETAEGERQGLRVDGYDVFLYPFDVTFTGWKDSDEHELIGGKVPYAPDRTVIGGSRFYAPIRHLDDDAVRRWLRVLAPEFGDFDDSLLLSEQGDVPNIPLDGQTGLSIFKQRFFGLGG